VGVPVVGVCVGIIGFIEVGVRVVGFMDGLKLGIFFIEGSRVMLSLAVGCVDG
jgi:hypothetical protein